MSGKIKDSHKKLSQLADALVEDIFIATDEEILKEVKADGGNPSQQADKVRALYSRTRTMMAKKRLLSAQNALATKREQDASRKPLELDPSEARRRLKGILQGNPEAAAQFTLAARKGGELSDADVLGMLEDLEELDISSSSVKKDEQK